MRVLFCGMIENKFLFGWVMAEHGRPKAIESPEQFEQLALDYIEWVRNNPVEKTITASFQGNISYRKIPHSRPMTQYGLAAHMGIGLSTLKDYGVKDDFSAIFKKICAIMTAHNVDGASSGDMNGNIIARIEGLAEKQEVQSKVTVNNSMNDFYADIESEESEP